MASQSLFDGCQSVIQKGHESWKSYFTKWESFAKYEEDIPESELFIESKKKTKSSSRKKLKQESNQTKSKALPYIKYKGNKISHKKPVKRKRNQPECNQEVKALEEYVDPNCENSVVDPDNMQLETILETVFTKILKAGGNEFHISSTLSQTISGKMNYSQIYQHRQVFPCSVSNPLQFGCNVDDRLDCPTRSNYIRNLNRSLFESKVKPIREQIGYSGLYSRFNQIHQTFFDQSQIYLPLSRNPSLKPAPITLGLRNGCHTFSSSLNTVFESVECDSSFKSPNSMCRKINKEYFIKRNFLKMNITQDGKRFRNLCLRKRTNSVTLSMENSNFITPERKPPERKCFSENVLQRKRTCPSKLFFGNEEDDSESDDETEKQTPVIHSRKKLKTERVSGIFDSDSDDCESIFDRVRV